VCRAPLPGGPPTRRTGLPWTLAALRPKPVRGEQRGAAHRCIQPWTTNSSPPD
jgi:hypothetical protein